MAAARRLGDWQAIERAAAQGLACLRRMAVNGEELGRETLEASELDFRRARRLISGEDTIEWLDRHGLTVSDWRDYIRRVVARDRWADELDETEARFPIAPEQVASVVWAEAVCSGALWRMASRLAGDAALAVESGESVARDRGQAFSRIAEVAEHARAAALSESSIAAEVERRVLGWLRVEGEILELPTEAMAREAAFLVRDDGRPLAEVGMECGTEVRQLRVYMDDASPELSRALLGAQEGELVGPLAIDNGFGLVLLERKTRPSTDDPDVRAKAKEIVVTRLTERAVAANVSWR